jgi:hypothetical protein
MCKNNSAFKGHNAKYNPVCHAEFISASRNSYLFETLNQVQGDTFGVQGDRCVVLNFKLEIT